MFPSLHLSRFVCFEVVMPTNGMSRKKGARNYTRLRLRLRPRPRLRLRLRPRPRLRL